MSLNSGEIGGGGNNGSHSYGYRKASPFVLKYCNNRKNNDIVGEEMDDKHTRTRACNLECVIVECYVGREQLVMQIYGDQFCRGIGL